MITSVFLTSVWLSLNHCSHLCYWHFVFIWNFMWSWNALFSQNNLLYQYLDLVDLLHMMKDSFGLILSSQMFLLNWFHQLRQLPSFVHPAWQLWCILVLWYISALIHDLNPSSVHCIFPAIQPIYICRDKNGYSSKCLKGNILSNYFVLCWNDQQKNLFTKFYS